MGRGKIIVLYLINENITVLYIVTPIDNGILIPSKIDILIGRSFISSTGDI